MLGRVWLAPPRTRPVGAARAVVAAQLGRFSRFAIVGAAGVLLNTTLLYLMTEVGRLNYLVAAAVATEVAILSNFTFNDRWTFRRSRSVWAWPRRALHYNLIALGGLLISLLVLALLTHWLGMHYLLANLVGIGVSTMWNYVVNCRLTWSTPVTTAQAEPDPGAPAVEGWRPWV